MFLPSAVITAEVFSFYSVVSFRSTFYQIAVTYFRDVHVLPWVDTKLLAVVFGRV